MAQKKSFVPPRKNTKKAGTSQGSGQQNQQIPDFLNDPNMLAYANLLAFNIANNQQMPTQESMPVDAQGSSTENEVDEGIKMIRRENPRSNGMKMMKCGWRKRGVITRRIRRGCRVNAILFGRIV